MEVWWWCCCWNGGGDGGENGGGVVEMVVEMEGREGGWPRRHGGFGLLSFAGRRRKEGKSKRERRLYKYKGVF